MLKKLLFLFLFLIPLISFPQEEITLVPYQPKEFDGSKIVFEKKVKHEIEKYKNGPYFQTLLAYFAVRDENLSLCKGDEVCLQVATEDFLPLRYLAEGRCDEIKHESWDDKNICKAIKTNSCNAMSGWKKDLCNGFMREDSDLLAKATTSSGFRMETGKTLNKKEAEESLLAIYLGYKYYSILPCERFLKDDLLSERLACDVLFSSMESKLFEELTRDMALFNISKDTGDSEICALIKNKKVRNKCLDKKVKSLGDIW